MSSRHSVYIPHKMKFGSFSGTLRDPKENFSKWAYWNFVKSGWVSSPITTGELIEWKSELEKMNSPDFLYKKELDRALEWFKKKGY